MKSSPPKEKAFSPINSSALEPASAPISERPFALKECSESEYWSELLIESGYYSDSTILERCIEMKKILISSIDTAKKNIKQLHLYVPERKDVYDPDKSIPSGTGTTCSYAALKKNHR